MIRRHSAKSMSSQAVNGTMAALLTRMSRPPKPSTAALTIAWTAAGSDTSTAIADGPRAAPPLRPWHPASLMSATTTAAPSSASLSAMARPIPWAPPVTIATRSSSFILRPPCRSGAVEVGGVLPGQPRRPCRATGRSRRRAPWPTCLMRLSARDRVDRVEVEPADDHPLERLVGVRGVARKDHRPPALRFGQQREVADRVARLSGTG